MRQLRLINAYTRHLKSGFTEMVKLAQWSNNYYFYIQQTEAYSVTHIKHSQQVFAKMLPAAQLDIPDEINSTGI